ncbi:NlpC/P60-like cell-wall peptidase [Pochonia chlamydosporia 170]|uniref:NlpC/P60-like cell-wall peptidase n=1 Tax=Pochonia chlamydosporia 170 TaxID=1380566 RepID=A0A179EZP7_METCM|nr:NlpC/P60-like cell-wall peptidase [Pochonia chlamydosporia 170]OAQ58638.1 NlpC/P60-like cell-wall peptidase [Pochonia chlamydosporia 170]
MKFTIFTIALAATGGLAAVAAVPGVDSLEKRDGPGIVNAAASVKGTPYVYGGGGCNGPSKGGFDCSGLTQFSVCKGQGGKTIPRTAQQQYHSNMGRRIPRGQAAAGDMVFWGTNGDCANRVVHVGIVVRPGVMINAATPGTVVREQNIWTSSGGLSICPDAVRFW